METNQVDENGAQVGASGRTEPGQTGRRTAELESQAFRQLGEIQALWGRYEWRQVRQAVDLYAARLQGALRSLCPQPAAAARDLAGRVRFLEETRDEGVVGRGDSGLLFRVPDRERWHDAVRGGAPGETLRGVMRVLDGSHPCSRLSWPWTAGSPAEAILLHWERLPAEAMARYQKRRGDVWPAREEDWVTRQKVALHRAEQVVDILDGHTSGYLRTRQSIAAARRRLLLLPVMTKPICLPAALSQAGTRAHRN